MQELWYQRIFVVYQLTNYFYQGISRSVLSRSNQKWTDGRDANTGMIKLKKDIISYNFL